VGYHHSDSHKLLQRLLDETITFIPEKGLFSPEFQAWHAAAIRVLRDRFGEGDLLYQEFTDIQFEWPLETLDALRGAVTSSLENPSPEILSRIAEISRSNKHEPEPEEVARVGAKALQVMAFEIDSHTQQRRFQSAMEHASEILSTALMSIDKR
jgi:hypothetical protein